MKQKFIIIYSENFRSTLIYSNFIENHHSKIKALIKVPNFPKKSGKINFLFLIKIFFSSHKYLLYQITQTFIYQFLCLFNKNSLKDLSKKYNIKFLTLNDLPKHFFLKKKIKNFNKKDIIFCSTSHILSRDYLKMKNIILNFHEAPLPEYRGSALYYHLVKNNVKKFNTTIIQPVKYIDAGKIELKSKNYQIKNFNVFKVLLLGYFVQSKLILHILNKKIIKISRNFRPKNQFKAYSVPSKKLEKYLNKNKKNIKYSDLFFLIRISRFNFKKITKEIEKFIF